MLICLCYNNIVNAENQESEEFIMTYNIMCLAAGLLTSFPVIGDTRNMKTPVIVAIIAVVLIVGCLILSAKPKNKDDKK